LLDLSWPCRLAIGLSVTTLLAIGACTGSPAKPTPTPPPPTPDPLKITCPAPVSQPSATGQPISVHYGAATTTGGTPPVEIVCTPASDTAFQVGSTAVACRASDTKTATDACVFTVTVTAPPPRLSLTNFVAFGDSMTAGEIVSEGSIPGLRILLVDFLKSYPADLRAGLAARYTTQSNDIVVLNQGKSAETAVAGTARLPSVLSAGAAQALLLMEGANDLPDTSHALPAMRTMVQTARGRGLRVFLATLPPQNPNATCFPNHGANWAFVVPYNDGLRSIAASENAVLVDVYSAFNGDTTTLVDCDGLHPTALGYQRIAETFLTSIRQTLELAPSTSPAMLTGPTVLAPRRR
jgi:lysophospholipase L1-like esterase